MNAIGPALPAKAAIPVRLLGTSTPCHVHRIARTAQSRAFCIAQPTRSRIPRRSSGEGQVRPSLHRSFHASSPKLATKDPYQVLGISSSATASDIKKAYYGLAKKYHPDTNKEASAKEQFAEAQSAYEILSDPKKKEAWDNYGAAAFDQGAGFNPNQAGAGAPFDAGGFSGFGGFAGFGGAQGGFGGQNINFEDLFGSFGGGGRRGGRNQRQQQEEVLVGENLEVHTSISFMDAAKGTTKDVTVHPLMACKACNGRGLKKGVSKSTCKKCGGTGTKVLFLQAGFQMATTCDACEGQGTTTPRGGECVSCAGAGVVREKNAIAIEIPAGVEDGMRMRVSGEGDTPATSGKSDARAARGDLYVVIRVSPDSKFRRSGSDVLYTATIPLTTAVLGGSVTVPTLDDEVKVKVATGTGTGDAITLGGMGMRRLGKRFAKGDLRVEFKVNMPKYLSANQRTILEMLADEMGDAGAKRIMGLDRMKPQSGASSSTDPSPPPPDSAEAHKNEGFLKSAWHRLTHQHDDLTPEPPGSEGKDGEEKEKKKGAAGSG